jgi:hypothetical protein
MRRVLFVALISFAGCRYLTAATPSVSPERPGILASGNNPADPSRQPSSLASNRCGLDCGPGRHCDEKTASCVADPVRAGAGDGGVSWLP